MSGAVIKLICTFALLSFIVNALEIVFMEAPMADSNRRNPALDG